MTRLTETHTTLLAAAAARGTGALLPPPESLRLRGAALGRTLGALLKRGLVAEVATNDEQTRWRRNEDGRGLGLVITPAGLAAIGVEASDAPPVSEDPERVPAQPDVPPPGPTRPRGKLGAVLEAVGRPGGATLDDLAAQAGWLPHTTRAALTGLRKRGFDVRLEEIDGRRAYRLGGAA